MRRRRYLFYWAALALIGAFSLQFVVMDVLHIYAVEAKPLETCPACRSGDVMPTI